MAALIETAAVRPLIADLEVSDDTVSATIQAVSDFARHEAGEVGAAWDPEATTGTTVVPGVVAQIVIMATVRRLRHGDASYERLGDYGHGVNLPSTGAVFTGYELSKLRGFRSAGSGVLSSLRMTRPGTAESLTAGTIYMPTTGAGGRAFPWSEP